MGKRKSSDNLDVSDEEQLAYFFTHLLATLNPAINKADTYDIMSDFFSSITSLDEEAAKALGYGILMTGARRVHENGH